MRHGVGRQICHDPTAALGRERELATTGANSTATKGEHIAIRQNHAQGLDVRTHGTIAIAPRTGRVARRHTAQAGGGLGGVGGEHLLGSLGKRLRSGLRGLVPPVEGEAFCAQVFAQLREDDAGLHAHAERPRAIVSEAEHTVHARKVEDVAAVGHRACGKTRSGALDGHGDATLMQLAQDRTDLVLALRERDGLRESRAARLIVQIVLMLGTACFNLNVCNPHVAPSPSMMRRRDAIARRNATVLARRESSWTAAQAAAIATSTCSHCILRPRAARMAPLPGCDMETKAPPRYATVLRTAHPRLSHIRFSTTLKLLR